MAVDDYNDAFQQYGQQYNVDPALLKAQAQVESSGNPNTPNSEAGAVGLMQMLPETAKSLNIDPSDPVQSIKGAAQLISQNLKRYNGDQNKAILAYHGGTDPDNWGPKTHNYLAKVNNIYLGNQAVDPTLDNQVNDLINDDGDDPALAAINKRIANSSTVAKSATDPVELALQKRLSAAEPMNINIGGQPNVAAPSMPGQQPGTLERELGIGARAAVNGITSAGGLLTDIPAGLGNAAIWGYNRLNPSNPTDHHFNYPGDTANQTINSLMTSIGVPSPASKGERLGSDIVGSLAGAKTFGASSPTQLVSAATGGLAGGEAREQGYGPGVQFGASLLGGGLVPAGVSAANSLGKYIEPLTDVGRNNIANRVIDKFGAGGNLLAGSNNAAELVPGSQPTLPEVTGNPGHAILQNTLRDMNAVPFVERAQKNSASRGNLLSEVAGTPEDIESAIADRSAKTNSAIDNVFGNIKPVDATPVVNQINSILAGPGGTRNAVSTSMNRILKQIKVGTEAPESAKPPIYDASGNVMNPPDLSTPKPIYENNPENLYQNARKEIGDMLDTKDLTSPAGRQAASQILQVRDALDDTIEQGAPGFKQYLKTYSSASKPIEAMKWMQGLNLTDQAGNPTLNKVQNALKNVNKLQQAPGTNAAKSLSDDQVAALQSVRDDLLRQNNLSSGRAMGSNTSQNDYAKQILQNTIPGFKGAIGSRPTSGALGGTIGGAIGTAAGGFMGHPVIGGAIGSFAGNKLSNLYNTSARSVINNIQDKMLNPTQYTPNPAIVSNPLAPAIASPIRQFITNQYRPALYNGVNALSRNRLEASQ